MLVEERGAAKKSVRPVPSLIGSTPEKTEALQSEEQVSDPVYISCTHSLYLYVTEYMIV